MNLGAFLITIAYVSSKVTGWGVERFGFRPFILTILCYQAVVLVTFFVAPSIEYLLLGACLAGIAFGVFMSGESSAQRTVHNKLTSTSRYLLRRRSLPCRSSRLYHHMGQLMLGYRTTYSHRRYQESVWAQQRMGISYSVWSPGECIQTAYR